jgi:large subunit ribosomal protein L31
MIEAPYSPWGNRILNFVRMTIARDLPRNHYLRTIARFFSQLPTGAPMKTGIHPQYKTIAVQCSCGNAFETRSTTGRDLHVEVCSSCHPFYTGKQRLVDTAGRVDKFRRRYGRV